MLTFLWSLLKPQPNLHVRMVFTNNLVVVN